MISSLKLKFKLRFQYASVYLLPKTKLFSFKWELLLWRVVTREQLLKQCSELESTTQAQRHRNLSQQQQQSAGEECQIVTKKIDKLDWSRPKTVYQQRPTDEHSDILCQPPANRFVWWLNEQRNAFLVFASTYDKCHIQLSRSPFVYMCTLHINSIRFDSMNDVKMLPLWMTHMAIAYSLILTLIYEIAVEIRAVEWILRNKCKYSPFGIIFLSIFPFWVKWMEKLFEKQLTAQLTIIWKTIICKMVKDKTLDFCQIELDSCEPEFRVISVLKELIQLRKLKFFCL